MQAVVVIILRLPNYIQPRGHLVTLPYQLYAVNFVNGEACWEARLADSITFTFGDNDDLKGWRQDHRTYFERNGGFDNEMALVCERFD